MIPIEVLLAFLAASALITIAPGPDNLMVLSVGISRGRAAGIGFGIGCALGCFVHTLWATLGIGAVVMASEETFITLKMAGAAYLVYIGIMAWSHAGKLGVIKLDDASAEPLAVHVRRGFIANVINPKVALFFIAFLPQFVDPARGAVWLQMLLLGALFAALTVVIFGSLGWSAGSLGARLQRQPKLAVWLDRCAGTIFFGLALHLAMASR
ncbi:MAG: LysE family translocator [Betaproteobacteria bacterium]|nr:LysE family translocator [Betaproteobacteria bacterium]